MPNRVLLVSDQKYYAAGSRHTGPWRLNIDTGVTTDFSLITNSTCNVDIDWGDGVGITTDLSGNTTTTHNYSTPGTYTVEITLNSGDFRPYYNSDAAGDELVTVGDTPAGWSFGANLQGSFGGSANLTTVGNIDTSAVTNIGGAWQYCTSLTSFPFINTSNVTTFANAWLGDSGLLTFPSLNTSAGLDFSYAWFNCNSLASFPALDISGATNLSFTWYGCSALESFSLTDFSSMTGDLSNTWNLCSSLDNITALGDTHSFPAILVPNATGFSATWTSCSSLTSFPPIAPTSATTFNQAWYQCSSLTTFPPNVFNVTGTLVTAAFNLAFRGCALTAQSIENILVSLDTNGATGVTLHIDQGTNAAKTTWSAAANAAYDNLVGNGWTVNHNP